MVEPASKTNSTATSLVMVLLLVAGLTTTTCCDSSRSGPPMETQGTESTPNPTPIWDGLVQQTPYPFTAPLPPARATVLDATYVQTDSRWSNPARPIHATATPPGGGAWMWHPVRPTVWVMPPGPYSVEGGRWILDLDQGVFRVLHETTGWHSLGSFSISGKRVQFFNDPNCMEAVGTYVWRLEAEQLLLEAIEDECGARSAFQSGRGMRARVLTSSPWTSGP